MSLLRVGLTGGIACGKSHVLARLAQAGLHTLDLDRVSREVTAPGGSAYDEVVHAFGHAVLLADQTLDRKALAKLVFADSAARERLNAIVHPRLRAEEERWARRFSAEPDAVLVTDAALLVESGAHLRFDRLVVVHCAEPEQLRRLMARDGIDEGAARSRIGAQMPLAEKRRFAHFEVDTSAPPVEGARAGDRLAAVLRELAARRGPRVAIPIDRALGAVWHGPQRGAGGLDPTRLLEGIVAANGLELERVAALMDPRPAGPWYRAGRDDPAAPGPEALMAPLAVWALASRPPDPEFLASAAASLARLTHRASAAVAGACFFALALGDALASGGIPADPEGWLASRAALAAQWGGAPPALDLGAVLRAARDHAASVDDAAAACRLGGGDPRLAASLVGTVVGAPVGRAPAGLVEALRRLLEPPSRA